MSSRCPAQTLSTEVPSAVLTLDPVTDPTVVGFRVYFGASSGQYSQMIDVGNATTATLSGLSAGETYFFVVTAYNVFGLESVPSSEVSFTAPAIGTIPPLFSFIPGAQTATASPGGFAAVPDVVSLTTVTDSVGVTSLTQSPPAGASIGVGSYPIVLTATDAAGNSATASVPFTVTPAVAPQFTFVPGAQTATANASGFAFVPEIVSLTTAAAVYYNVGVTSLTQSPLADASVGVGSYTIVLTATDSAGNSTTANVPFTVNPPIGPSGLAYTSNPASYTIGVPIANNSPSSSGGAVASYSVSPPLPTGLILDPIAGVISGTPAAITAPAIYVVTAANAGGSAAASLTIEINDIPPASLTYSGNPATYTIGSAITANTPSNTGGTVVSYSVSPALAAGLTLNTATGVISGTPTVTSTAATFTVTASNTGGATTSTLSLTVAPATPTQWRQQYFGSTANAGNAANTADPFNTGVPNLLAFAFFGPNQSPAQASISQLPPLQTDGANLFFSFAEPNGVSGVTYGAEWNTALISSSWQTVTDTGSGNTHLFAVPIGNNTQIFLRLTVTAPSP